MLILNRVHTSPISVSKSCLLSCNGLLKRCLHIHKYLEPVLTALAPGHLGLKGGEDVEEAVAHHHVVVDGHDDVGDYLKIYHL